jgi:hypothetical protein
MRAKLAIVTTIFVVLTSVYSAADAATTYYRWKDDNGKLVVSDRPPSDEDISYEVVTPSTSIIRRVESGEGAVPPETVPSPGNEFEPEDTSADELQVARKNPEICARAQKNLETLNTTARIRIHDSDSGELRYLTEDEKEAQREKARDVIRAHCE